MSSIKKIVAIGPESTGKSTLCARLAGHYDTLWVREYAREFLEVREEYTYDNLLDIARGQIELEDQAEKELVDRFKASAIISSPQSLVSPTPLLFVDTDLYVIQVWCEFVYNRCHNWILSQIATRRYDGYLLCNVDLPWEQDGMREYPEKKIREKLFHYYKELMVSQSVPWVEISGDHEQRLEKAVAFVEGLKGKNS